MNESPALWSLPCLSVVAAFVYNQTPNLPSLSLFLSQNGF